MVFESERQAYLNALGIVQYTARQPIAGALESPQLTDEQIYSPEMLQAVEPTDTQSPDISFSTQPVPEQRQNPQQPQASAASQSPATRSESVSTEGLKLNIPQELLGEPQQSPQTHVAQKATQAHQIEFCFGYIETGAGISLLVELGDAGVKDMSAIEHRLLNDIFHALSIPADQCRYHYFKWPLVNNPKIKQGLPEARETLVGYLEGKLAQRPVTTLVAMGEAVKEVLEIHEQQLTFGDHTLMTIKTSSLSDMVADWQHKAYAWRMLAPLRGRNI